MKFRLILGTVAFCAALPISFANAAPQLLGLFADNRLPLHCVDGSCTVEVSAICLQEERDMPAWGTAYRAIQPDRIALIGTDPSGAAIKLPIGERMHFESDRGSWSVNISIPETAVAALGVSEPALAIEGRVALSPIPVQDDPSPQTAADIGKAVTTFENASDAILGTAAEDMAAAHILNKMINALPHVTLDTAKPAGDLWHKVFGSEALDQPGMKRAAAYYQRCGHELLIVDQPTVRRCLELGHDGFLTTINRRYWDATGPGV